MGILVSYEAARKAKEAGDLKGLYQFQLAQLLGICESYLSKILNGGVSVEPEHTAKMCEVLGTDPEDFCRTCPLFQIKQQQEQQEQRAM